MTRTMAFTMVFLTAFAGCGGATDESSDSTEATRAASDEISTDTDGGTADGATATTTDGGSTTKTGDGGEACGDGKPGK